MTRVSIHALERDAHFQQRLTKTGTNVFEPENKLETLMQAAVKDPGLVQAFYKTLLETEIFILTPDAPMEPGRRRSLKYQEQLNVATVEFQGMKWHPTFTSRVRIEAYLKEQETCLGIGARHLFEMLPGSNFWLNPLSECQKPLPASEVELLMNGKIYDMLKPAN